VRKLLLEFAPQFGDYGQHDAHEYLRFLLDGLHEDLNRVRHKVAYEELKDIDGEDDAEKSDRWWRHYKERNDSAIMDIFCGQLRSAVVCSKCEHVSTAFDPFYDLSLPIPQGGAQVTLDSCFKAFTAEERLAEDYTCSKCKSTDCCSRKLDIYRWPRVLVVHLKRFTCVIPGRRYDKLPTNIDFPRESLDLTLYGTFVEDPPPIYDLFAVSNHIGSCSGGHYTAYSKNFDSNAWGEFDDARTTPEIPAGKLCGKTAYLLFYGKQIL